MKLLLDTHAIIWLREGSSRLGRRVRDTALASRLTVLPITPEIAASATDLQLPHADPFDRLIVATAIHHLLPLATRERQITAANLVPVVWD